MQNELKVDSIVAQISKLPYKTHIESILKDTFSLLNNVSKNIKYLKGTIAIEEKFAHFIVKENSIKVMYTSERNVPNEMKNLIIT